MLKFSVHTDGLSAIPKRLKSASEKAEHIVAIQVQKDTAPFVPASGAPAGLDARTKVDNNLIIYPGPYAHYLYIGKLYVYPETGSSYAPYGSTKVATDKNLVFSKAVHGDAQSHWLEPSKAENLEKWLRVADKAVKREL